MSEHCFCSTVLTRDRMILMHTIVPLCTLTMCMHDLLDLASSGSNEVPPDKL